MWQVTEEHEDNINSDAATFRADDTKHEGTSECVLCRGQGQLKGFSIFRVLGEAYGFVTPNINVISCFKVGNSVFMLHDCKSRFCCPRRLLGSPGELNQPTPRTVNTSISYSRKISSVLAALLCFASTG
jgi:hypothetical protein